MGNAAPVDDCVSSLAVISDAALHKICKKHGIPKPPVGYWMKKEAGHEVPRTPLPAADPNGSERIRIVGGELAVEPASLIAIREEARVLASSDGGEAPPDPLVERTISKLRKARRAAFGLVSVCEPNLVKCEVAEGSLERLGIILNRVAHAALQLGFRLVPGEKSACFEGDTGSLTFSISESLRREKHQVTPAEQAKLDAWQRKRDRAALTHSWDDVFFSRPEIPEWDHHPSGLLSLELEHFYVRNGASPRRSFRDAKVQRLDNIAGEIAVGIAVLVAAKNEERLRREEEHRRYEEQQRLREAAARKKHVEERRTASLSSITAELHDVDRLERLVAALEQQLAGEKAPRVAAFLSWAKEHLAERQRQLAASELEARFEKAHLFGENDDFDFRASRWG
jgi:hypothetical protein